MGKIIAHHCHHIGYCRGSQGNELDWEKIMKLIRCWRKVLIGVSLLEYLDVKELYWSFQDSVGE